MSGGGRGEPGFQPKPQSRSLLDWSWQQPHDAPWGAAVLDGRRPEHCTRIVSPASPSGPHDRTSSRCQLMGRTSGPNMRLLPNLPLLPWRLGLALGALMLSLFLSVSLSLHVCSCCVSICPYVRVSVCSHVSTVCPCVFPCFHCVSMSMYSCVFPCSHCVSMCLCVHVRVSVCPRPSGGHPVSPHCVPFLSLHVCFSPSICPSVVLHTCGCVRVSVHHAVRLSLGRVPTLVSVCLACPVILQPGPCTESGC